MSDEINATPVTDVGAAAPVSTPEAAPAATTPEATPATPVVETPAEFKPPAREIDEDPKAFLDRVSKARDEFDAAQAKPKDPLKSAPEVKTEAEKPKVDEATPEDNPDEKSEDKKPDTPVETTLSLDDKAPLPPQELSALLEQNPDLASKLDELGIKEQVFEGQRLASQAVAYQEVFPGGLEDAKYAREQAENFGKLDELYTSIKDGGLDAVDQFIGALSEMDVLLNAETGQPVLDAQGNPVSQGHTQAFLSQLGDYTFSLRLNHLEQSAREALKADPDNTDAERSLAAIEILKESMGGASTAKDEQLTPAQRAEAERLKSERAELDRIQQANSKAEITARENRITETADNAFNSEVLAVLKQTDLRPEQHAKVLEEIRGKVAEKLAHDAMFTSKRDWIMRSQYSPKVEQLRIAHNLNSMRAAFRTVAKSVLSEYGSKVLNQQAERQAKIKAQVDATKSEPKGSAAAAAPAKLSNAEIHAKAREILRAEGKDEYDEGERLRAVQKLRAQGF